MTILKPVIPGTVLRFIGERIPTVPPSAADTVAVPIVSDWGPVGSDAPGESGREGGAQTLQSFAEYTAVFGDSDTAGRTAVAGAFAGQNLPGAAGAGAVVVFRMAGTSKAKATLIVKNTTPATAITLTARYYGSRGNKLSIVIDVNPANAAQDRLRLLYNGAVVETFIYTKTDIKGLNTAINAQSQYIKATEQVTGVALTATAGTPLAGGDDGATLLTTDHVKALEALEYKPFSIIAPYVLEGTELLAAYKSWIETQEAANRPVMLVVGGKAAETITEAVTRSGELNNPHIVNFGVGTYHDDLLAKDLSTAQLAPRIAGILAARGRKSSLTYARIGGLHPIGETAPPHDAIETAIRSGVTVLMRGTNPEAELQIAKGVTTWTSTTNLAQPVEVFGDPRLVRIMDLYVREMKEWGDSIVIGALPVNSDTRDLVRGQARKMQDELIGDGLILSGGEIIAGVEVPKPFVSVELPSSTSMLDTIPYQFGWQFARTANFILGEGRVR